MKYSFIQVLSNHWWVFVVSLLVSLAATPVVRFIAYRTGIVDKPDALLKPHGRPIAYLGGLAMCLGLLVGLGAYATAMPNAHMHWRSLTEGVADFDWLGLMANPMWNLIAIGVACLLITIVGLLDDIYNIKPRQKILGQALSAAVLIFGGVGTGMALTILGYFGNDWPLWVLLPVRSVLCLMLVVAACNATNLLDGLDGLCGGVTAIIAIGFLALAATLAMWGFKPGLDELRVALCLAMVGAVLGFLPYNIPPASIFMGDAGSMLLGFFVAIGMAMFCLEANPRWLAAAVVVFLLPILDTGLAVIRRMLSGKPIFAGDRSHLYDQLVDRGMSVKKVVVLFYVLAAALATIGVLSAMLLRLRYALLIYVGLLCIAALVFWRLRMFRPPARRETPEHAEHG
jgi:UDP-GlcNAc:undecaprenyl-phosphate GlcNAc-1-phosphate transferase